MEKITKTELLYKEYIVESDKIVKYLLNFTIIAGSIGFLSVGASSYLGYNIIPFLKSDQIIFFPQGLTMCFYGSCGTIIGINQMRILISNIGEGYNEFNKQLGTMTVFRKGNKSDIKLTYPLKDILRIKLYTSTLKTYSKDSLWKMKQKIFSKLNNIN